tara:strand:- start:4092 stop:4766 length:675 start_codon:yes stop_codon:yes gene_type:complete
LAEKSTPVLGSALLEGLFAEMLSQIKSSLDCCWHWHDTKISQEENVVATWLVTMEETRTVVDITKNHSTASLNKKHRYFVKRLRSFYRNLIEMDVETNDRKSMKEFLGSLTMFMMDSHLILSEETPRKIREYLSGKGAYVKEGGESEGPSSQGVKRLNGRDSGSCDKGAGGVGPSGEEAEEGSSWEDESEADGSDPSGMGIRVARIRPVEEAWDCTANDPQVED